MRLSTSTNILNFDVKMPYMASMEHAVTVCAAAGYHYIDANLCGMSRVDKRFSPMTEDNWEELAHSWRKMADDMGVAFKQGHAYFKVGGPVEKGTMPGGDFGEEMMRRSVIAAEILGVEWLVVHPVTVIDENGEGLPKDEIYQYNLAYFKRWKEFFKAHNVGMAIENMATNGKIPSIFADMDTLCSLIDEVGEPEWVGACLDTGHANISGLDPAECVHKIGKRLRATHINDNHGTKVDEHIAPFMGTINWVEVVKALREIDYKHDFSFETHHLTSSFPLRIQPDLIRFSYTLGQYLLSDDLTADAEARKQYE